MKKRFGVIFLLMCCMLCLAGCKKEETKEIRSAKDLKGAKIGVQLGTVGDIYASDYENDKAGTKVERYNKCSDAIQALRQQKNDCVIMDEQPAMAAIEGDEGLKILDEAFALEEYAICIAKGNDTLQDQINQALEELRSEGIIDQIIENYIGDDTKGTCPYERSKEKATNGTLIVATNATFPPYEYYEDGEVTGIDMELAQAIADKLGKKLEIQDMEFDAIINSVNSQKADIGMAGMTMTEERQKSIDFSAPYTTAKQVMIVNTKEDAGTKIGLMENLKRNFVTDSRWKYILEGFLNTIIIALCAAVLGLILGFAVAIIRCTYEKNHTLRFLNGICKGYLTIIRGTPIMIQLLLIYYVVFQSVNMNKIIVAILAFAINSGAYVAEIMRGGILSIDNGQFEAGRSLGFNYGSTMLYIILPQAIKNGLAALANEFISLLKETSICGYIGLMDLTRGGDVIRSITYEAFLPLIAVALIYLLLVQLLTMAVGKMERGMRRNEQ